MSYTSEERIAIQAQIRERRYAAHEVYRAEMFKTDHDLDMRMFAEINERQIARAMGDKLFFAYQRLENSKYASDTYRAMSQIRIGRMWNMLRDYVWIRSRHAEAMYWSLEELYYTAIPTSRQIVERRGMFSVEGYYITIDPHDEILDDTERYKVFYITDQLGLAKLFASAVEHISFEVDKIVMSQLLDKYESDNNKPVI